MKSESLLVLCSTLLLLSLLPTNVLAQSNTACARDVTVVAGDTLTDLADNYLGDPLAYPRIIAATTAAAEADDSYATIEDEGSIAIGWKLCIPGGGTSTELAPPTTSASPVTAAPPTVAAPTGASSTTLWSADADALQIEVMRQQAYPGSPITFEQTLEAGINYSRYLVSYRSEGLKIYALMTVPDGPKPAAGWPVIVFNHGYIPPAQYRTTERYVAYVDMLARNGYIVFKPDYRGFGSSEGDDTVGGGYGAPDYTVDVLNAVASLKAYADADPDRIGMWGHSMGGQLVLRSMVVTQDIKAGVIWGGVVAPYPDIIERWYFGPAEFAGNFMDASSQNWIQDFGSWVEDFSSKHGAPEQNPAYWATISPNTYLADLSGTIELHHSTTDEMVPVTWSETLAQELEEVDSQPYELYTYQGDNHNISANFDIAMQRTVAFFDRYVKGM